MIGEGVADATSYLLLFLALTLNTATVLFMVVIC